MESSLNNKQTVAEPLGGGACLGNEKVDPSVQVAAGKESETDPSLLGGEKQENITDESGGIFEMPAESPNLTDNGSKEAEEVLIGDRNETNFTWAHFFHHHCGILPQDSLKYEKELIAHRLSPEDTLLESIRLIVQFGRIPLGDKLKLIKTINRREEILLEANKQKADAAKRFGLEGYTDFEVKLILALGGGDGEDNISFGMEEYECGKIELEREMTIARLKNEKFEEVYSTCAAWLGRARDPVVQLLNSFGYRSFNYTKGKSIDESLPQTKQTSRDRVVQNLLFGNLDSTNSLESEDSKIASMAMYS